MLLTEVVSLGYGPFIYTGMSTSPQSVDIVVPSA